MGDGVARHGAEDHQTWRKKRLSWVAATPQKALYS